MQKKEKKTQIMYLITLHDKTSFAATVNCWSGLVHITYTRDIYSLDIS